MDNWEVLLEMGDLRLGGAGPVRWERSLQIEQHVWLRGGFPQVRRIPARESGGYYHGGRLGVLARIKEVDGSETKDGVW